MIDFKCKECSEKIDKNKKFCNSSCAAKFNNRGRKLSQNTKNKISISVKESFKNLTEEDKLKLKIKRQEIGILQRGKVKRNDTHVKKLLSSPFDCLSWDRKRKRIRLEQNDCCGRCGINEWQEEKITLEIDHRDGDRKNNTRENLIGLCPNCHSLTPTWRGRNKKDYKKDVTDEILKETLLKHKKIVYAFRELDIAENGKNYKRARRLLKERL